jgi:hypothetical protein
VRALRSCTHTRAHTRSCMFCPCAHAYSRTRAHARSRVLTRAHERSRALTRAHARLRAQGAVGGAEGGAAGGAAGPPHLASRTAAQVVVAVLLLLRNHRTAPCAHHPLEVLPLERTKTTAHKSSQVRVRDGGQRHAPRAMWLYGTGPQVRAPGSCASAHVDCGWPCPSLICQMGSRRAHSHTPPLRARC